MDSNGIPITILRILKKSQWTMVDRYILSVVFMWIECKLLSGKIAYICLFLKPHALRNKRYEMENEDLEGFS